MNGKIVNCFYDGSESGFGDFLRGSIHLYDRCKNHNLDFSIDTSHHPIKKYIKTEDENKFHQVNIDCLTKKAKGQRFKEYFHAYNEALFNVLSSTKNGQTNYIFSSFDYISKVKPEFVIKKINDLPKLSNDCRLFFKNNLSFDPLIKEAVKKELNSHKLIPKKFNIIHFRLGDEKAFYKTKERFYTPSFDECFEICKKKTKTYKNPIVIISDSNDLKSYIKKKAKKEKLPLHVFHLESSHVQKNPSGSEESNSEANVTEDGLFYAAFDMRLISLASRGCSYSVYDHGSGFFAWICKIYSVPFKMEKFQKNKQKHDRHKQNF